MPPPNTAKAAAAGPLGPIGMPFSSQSKDSNRQGDYRRNYAPTQLVVKAGRLELRPGGTALTAVLARGGQTGGDCSPCR